MTPRFNCSGVSCEIMLKAPRILKAPMGCRDSAFRYSRESGLSATALAEAGGGRRPSTELGTTLSVSKGREAGLSRFAASRAETGHGTSNNGVTRAAGLIRSRATLISSRVTSSTNRSS
jgi:hypothetical protein